VRLVVALADGDAAVAMGGTCASVAAAVRNALRARNAARFDAARRRLGNDLARLRRANTLNLDSKNINADAVAVLARCVVRASRSLGALCLGKNKIGDEGTKHLAEGIRASGSLACLYLNQNNIGNEGAKALATAVAASGSLTWLELQHNDIGDEGAKHLAEAILGSRSLKHIELRDNNIGDEGAKALAAAVNASWVLALQRLLIGYPANQHAELKAACESKRVMLM
jgi:Ran GTPase-activating protein (RanGAP) involved in mRNA processing and transport